MTTPTPAQILDRLYAHHGRPQWDGPDDLLGVLVRTILSQQTTRKNCRRAFAALVDTYAGDWGRVQGAPVDELAEVIAVAGLANQKAGRIQELLGRLDEERGEYSLEFLRPWDLQRARDYLSKFRGVGPKTAGFTLMEAADMAAFPMDTHILRICRRLGWIAESTSSTRAHQIMEAQIPAGQHYAAHVVLVEHGRAICSARRPDCKSCPIADLCVSSQA